jgi:hypothetical protein
MRPRAVHVGMLAAALLGVVVGRGCGFGPSDSFTGRRIGDGVAPYTDQGEVRVCAGNDRLGPPTSLPGGYCDKATPGAPCDADADCRSRERCVCGVCTVQFCSSSSECGFGRVCSFVDSRCDRPCASKVDCVKGESCINQVCRSGPCTADTQCQTGERCGTATPRRCVVDPCDSDAACSMFPGRFCKVQRRPRTAREPTVMLDTRLERPFVMFLSLDEPGGLTAIYRADSDDGKSFRLDPADRAVLSPGAGDGNKVDAPSVIRAADGTLSMYFEVGGVSIARASSPDGRVWTRSGSVLTASQSWEGARVGAPAAALARSGHTLLFYEGGTAAGIGLAIAPAGSTSFTRAGTDGRVLSPAQATDPVLWRGVSAVGSPFADVVPGARGADDEVRVWFAARGEESSAAKKLGVLTPVPANFSIGFASAVFSAGKLSALVPHAWNPVFDRIEGFLVHPSELSPAVVEAPEGERYLLYYGRAAVDGSGYANLGVAENP